MFKADRSVKQIKNIEKKILSYICILLVLKFKAIYILGKHFASPNWNLI